MTTFYSHGKLLITAEYAVLDGAKALALPTKFGQSLKVKSINSSEIHWKSFDFKGNLWFETILHYPDFKSNNNSGTAKRLSECFNAIAKLQPDSLKNNMGYEMHSHLEFPQHWGLGSSSTLINNLAQWANVDAYELLKLTFGGSGYDVARAQNPHPILYQRKEGDAYIKKVDFNPSFKENLFFIHRNEKQNSREAIAVYNRLKTKTTLDFSNLNAINDAILKTSILKEFEELITKHETIVGELLQQSPLKTTHFPDFKGTIKSLGAWGGDFFLATGQSADMDYFINKGYTIIVPYSEMILEQ